VSLSSHHNNRLRRKHPIAIRNSQCVFCYVEVFHPRSGRRGLWIQDAAAALDAVVNDSIQRTSEHEPMLGAARTDPLLVVALDTLDALQLLRLQQVRKCIGSNAHATQ